HSLVPMCTLTPLASDSASMRSPPPTSPLFPYTTLFRSKNLLVPVGTPVASLLEFCGAGSLPCQAVMGSAFTGFTVPDGDTAVTEIGRAPSELQSRFDLVCRLLLEKKKIKTVEQNSRK